MLFDTLFSHPHFVEGFCKRVIDMSPVYWVPLLRNNRWYFD